MSALARLAPRLQALPLDQVQAPSIPIADLHEEASNLLYYLVDMTKPEHPLTARGAGLVQVKIKVTELEDFATAISASREAQAQWTVASSRSKSEDQVQREAAGIAHRARIVAASRYHLADDAQVQDKLDEIQEGEGIADLIADLEALTVLVRAHAPVYEGDTTFNPHAEAELAANLAVTIAAGQALYAANPPARELLDLRDRASTFLERLLARLRLAGRWAYREHPEILKHFASKYARERRLRAKARAAAEPTAEATGTPTP